MNRRSFNRYLQYTEKYSTQTLRQGLEEYFQVNPHVTDPKRMREDFGKLLMAHDITHVLLGYDTDMRDEWRLFFLTFFVSTYTFKDYVQAYQDWLRDRDDPSVSATLDDVLKQQNALSWYGWAVISLLLVLPEIIVMWFQTRRHQKYWSYYEYEPMLERSLLDIRQEFNLLDFIPLRENKTKKLVKLKEK
ncbi:MAG: hypothetical protein WBB43_28045 [Limnoraphis sp.]